MNRNISKRWYDLRMIGSQHNHYTSQGNGCRQAFPAKGASSPTTLPKNCKHCWTYFKAYIGQVSDRLTKVLTCWLLTLQQYYSVFHCISRSCCLFGLLQFIDWLRTTTIGRSNSNNHQPKSTGTKKCSTRRATIATA